MTTQDTEVSVEDRLTNLLDSQEQSAAEDRPEAEEKTEQEAAAADEATQEEQLEDVEFEGKAYKLPPELKRGILREKDYTQKTQELAEHRKAVEERAQFLERAEQFQQAAFKKAVELSALEQQLEKFEAVDWSSLATQDPAEFVKLDRAQRSLQEKAQRVRGEMQETWQQHHHATEQERQRALERGQQALARDIPGWGNELAKKVISTGRQYGFSDQELSSIADPRLVKVMHDAMRWKDLQASKPELTKKVSDAKPMKVVSRSAPQAQKQAAIGDARTALKKTGRDQDATAYFERLLTRK